MGGCGVIGAVWVGILAALTPSANMASAMIALDKCTKKNGALFYYSKSQKLGILKHKSSFVPGSSQTLNDLKVLKKFKKTTPALNIGDILIHHCLVIHGSDKNNSNRSRVGLTVRYIGKSSKINQSAKLRYEKSLKKQLV